MSELISALAQLLLAALLPLLIYLFQPKPRTPFIASIGLTRPPRKAVVLGLAASLLFVIAGLLLSLLNDEVLQLLRSPDTVTGKLRAMGPGVRTWAVLLLIAWVKTALAEEIFFRGFMAKLLVRWFGPIGGSILQALVFALVHVLLFRALTHTPAPTLSILFALTFLAGWSIGHIKERYAMGSIVPGWLAHGFGNTIVYAVIAFG